MFLVIVVVFFNENILELDTIYWELNEKLFFWQEIETTIEK